MTGITKVDHIRFYVGNALLSEDYYCSKFGFSQYAHEGFQTGNRHLCTRVVKQQDIIFAFTSALTSRNEHNKDFHDSYQKHGDNHVRDVAFQVDCVQSVFDKAVKNGAKVIQEPRRFYYSDTTLSNNTHQTAIRQYPQGTSSLNQENVHNGGYIEMAVIQPPFAGWVHTLINRDHGNETTDNNSIFLPGYQRVSSTPDKNLMQYIDHMACAIERDSLHTVIQWYKDALGFSRFLSSDDDDTENGISIASSDEKAGVGLRTMVMTPSQQNSDTAFKIVFVEPVNTNTTKSQIQEFLDYHGSTGIAHLAVNTRDIISSVSLARQHNVPLISVPHTYYSKWRTDKTEMYEQVKEDWRLLEQQSILCDGKLHQSNSDVQHGIVKRFDYLLQIFTLPLQDRPTFYLELIQREGANGFGKGNIKSLFDAIEELQKERGNFDIVNDNDAN